jgi:hypothetical protein
MSSWESVLYQLTSGFLSQTSFPSDYLKIPEIANALIVHKWHITGSNQGWTDVMKIRNYYS